MPLLRKGEDKVQCALSWTTGGDPGAGGQSKCLGGHQGHIPPKASCLARLTELLCLQVLSPHPQRLTLSLLLFLPAIIGGHRQTPGAWTLGVIAALTVS